MNHGGLWMAPAENPRWNILWTTTGQPAEECPRMRVISSRFEFHVGPFDRTPYAQLLNLLHAALVETKIVCELDGKAILESPLSLLPCGPGIDGIGNSGIVGQADPLAGRVTEAGSKFRVRREGGRFEVRCILHVEPLPDAA